MDDGKVVYLVSRFDESDMVILGAYSSKKVANQQCKILTKVDPGVGDDIFYEVSEVKLNDSGIIHSHIHTLRCLSR